MASTTSHRHVRAPVTLTALLVLLCGWVTLAPAQIGGATTYVVVNGGSMLPKYEKGDLVLTRRASSYAIGDVAAYMHPELGPVIHRVVAHAGSRYVLQGDANAWLDDYRPAAADMLGRSAVHLPSIGTLLEKSRSGTALIALSIVIGVLVMSLFTSGRSQRLSSLPRSARDRSVTQPPRRPDGLPQGTARDWMWALTVVLLASLVLGGVAFSRPATVSEPHRAEHTHTGVFGYSADAPSGLYDTDRVRTGQPVFRKVTDSLMLHFAYRLATERTTADMQGDYRLRARISDPTNGWSRTLLLRPTTPFRDGQFSTTVALDLTELQRVITAMQERTGAHTDRYALTFTAQVAVRGVVGEQPVQESFAPGLHFWLDGLLLQLQEPDGDAGSQDKHLHPTQAGGATTSLDQPNTVTLLGLGLPVPAARLLAVLGALLSSIGLLILTRPLLRAMRGDPASRIDARFGHLMVTIDGPPTVDHAPVHVTTIGDLVKLAHATGRTILHRPRHDGDDYYVHEPDVLYHHRVDRVDEPLRSAPEPGPPAA